MLELPPAQFKLVIDSVVWAFKHTMRDIADTGLNSELRESRHVLTSPVAFEVVNNFASSAQEIANQFYQQYLLNMLGDVFYVITDADHKSGFKMQAILLARLISLVETNAVQAPLFDPATVEPGLDNKTFLKKYIEDLLSTAFGHVQP